MQNHAMDYYTYYVYILASRQCGYLYVGITENILRRTHEHKTHADPDSHTARHNITDLVYYEVHNNVMEAIFREKKLKKWRRNWKFNLIEKNNPTWQDLYPLIQGLNSGEIHYEYKRA